jgi:hypothetical protein
MGLMLAQKMGCRKEWPMEKQKASRLDDKLVWTKEMN